MRSSRGASVTPPRVYGVGVCAGRLVVHDPLTGMTHYRNQLITVGRTMLRASEVATHPVADPIALGGSGALGVRWSPVVQRDPSPTCVPADSVHRRAARALACAGLLTVDLHEVEPLPTPDLTDIAGHLTDDGCTVSLTTEHCPAERHAEALADCVDALRICVDSAVTGRHHLGPDERERRLRSLVSGTRATVAAGLPTQLYTRVIPPPPGNEATRWLVELADAVGAHGVTFARPHGDGTLTMPSLTAWGADTPPCGTLKPLDVPLDTVCLRSDG
ncbi:MULTISPECIES: hypothetical protein [Streptomyces]|uniref:hypothetical protein n=1 Tax=Streptomyces TaxID=1883 RepID=UPI0008239C9C|nr:MULTISPECIES: hypothetical protein [Streptomyces]MCX5446521.1 hypothetical protein [Streptomyces libani]MYT15962.1 hypothetical protein [Streptomyces sp. SID4951]WDT53637.1 hypothetical protein NUT86_06015 [Streptomyces sp. G7(2002)]SCK26029.1 hypothetical protein YWIDRAFT_05461 [Streptomyces sp. SceaMP-e96]